MTAFAHQYDPGSLLMGPRVRRLSSTCRPALRDHFARLNDADLYLRFGGHRSPQTLDEYIDGIDFERSVVLGVFDDELELIGAAHLSPERDGYELGLSVIASARSHGIGGLLLRRAIQRARISGARRIYVHCLAENHALVSLVRAVGASVVVSAGEADGVIELPVATPFGAIHELGEEQWALFDFGLKVQRLAQRAAMDSKRQAQDSGARIAAAAGDGRMTDVQLFQDAS